MVLVDDEQSVGDLVATAVFTRTGQGRVAFAHSSFAAFLAARYLAARLTGAAPIPRRQLEGFFLVSAPDEDTAAIPELYVRSPRGCSHMRPPTCGGLPPRIRRCLPRTPPSSPTRRPGGSLSTGCWPARTVSSLSTVLGTMRVGTSGTRHSPTNSSRRSTTPPNIPLASGPLTRARLALRLAGDSGLTTLAGPLLRLVENEQWPVYLRQRATRTTMALDPGDTTVGRLRGVLSGLALHSSEGDGPGPFDEVNADSPAELVGTLLRLLWPDHLSFAEAAVHIRPG